MNGKRPRDWKPSYLEAIRTDLVSRKSEAYQYLLLSEWHFDRNEYRDARLMLECAKAFDKSGKAFLIPDALLLAIIERDALAAQELLARVTPKHARSTFGYWLAMGAANLSACSEHSAKMDLERAEDALRRLPLSTEADCELLGTLQCKADDTLTYSLPASTTA